jgi:hypothetical protein
MKKLNGDEPMPRHEAIVALKKIASDRHDPYLANEIEMWIQRYIVQFGLEASVSRELLGFVKDPVDYIDHVKKKGLVEIGTSAANVNAEIFDVFQPESTVNHKLRFRMLGLRPSPLEGGEE